MTAYRAAWVCPIDQPPIRNGAVRVSNGRIAAIGTSEFKHDDVFIDMGDAVLLPGLINAHTHLELSWLRGRVPPANRFTDWVKTLVAIRRGTEQAITPEIVAPIHDAISELQWTGTVAIGEVTNSLAAVEPMVQHGVKGVVFHELLGFRERDGAVIAASREKRDAAARRGVRVTLAAHAPYSTSVELFKAIREAVNASPCPIMAVHLGESPEEVELLATGGGPWRGMLETIGVWRDDWTVPQ